MNGKKPKKPKPFRKKTGEYDVFLHIAATQPHICYITDTPVNVWLVPGKLDVNCFMHVISKGADVRMRLWVPNIRIAQPWAHHIYDQGTAKQRKEMAEKYPNWHRLHELKDELKEQFNKKSPID